MATVFLADHRSGNIRVMQQALAQAGHTGVGVDGRTDLEAAIAASERPVVGVVDMPGLGRDAESVCARMHGQHVPFLILLGPRPDRGRTALPAGAQAMLNKPITRSVLLDSVQMLTESVKGGGSP